MFRAALGGLATQPVETFMTAPSPGIIATTLLNAHYDSHEAYVFALARQMRQGIRADRARLHPADRCARPRHGTHRPVPGQEHAGVPEDRRDACRGAERGARRHPARARPASLLLGQLRRAARRRHPDADILPALYQAKVGALVDRVRQSAPPARVCGAQEEQAARPIPAAARRDRLDHQLRRASRGHRQPHLRGGRRRGRQEPRHRLERLRLRHFRRWRDGHRGRGVGQAQELQRGRRIATRRLWGAKV